MIRTSLPLKTAWSMCTVNRPLPSAFFFFNDTATTEIYTLSLHDALPISECGKVVGETRGDEVPVDHTFLVDPVRARVQAVVSDACIRGHPAAFHDPRANRYPRRVADRGNDFATFVHRADERQDLLVLAHPIRARDAPGDHDGVEILRLQGCGRHVDLARVRVLRRVGPLLVTCEDHLGPFLHEPVVWHPELEILVSIFREHDDFSSSQRHVWAITDRGQIPCA